MLPWIPNSLFACVDPQKSYMDPKGSCGPWLRTMDRQADSLVHLLPNDY